MKSVLEKQLELLVSSNTHLLLKWALHGIEKEGLRVDSSGELSQKSHPQGLGSALLNSNITTDFSESLLELITPVFADPEAAIRFLTDLHHFTHSHLGDELIWAGSMPCRILDHSLIPIAEFGSSNLGKMKHVYRIGLEHRYGKMMQSIAGLHYNFSMGDDFWRSLQADLGNTETLQAFRSASYFKMIRNFRRHSWLLLYLFGASPALCDSFLMGQEHSLQTMHDRTLYLPHATSLRMSDLGYTNKVQSSLGICFNHLHTYIKSLEQAIQTPYSTYQEIGIKVDGRYRQLNDTILQIENEHYSDVRPKRVGRKGERPLQALRQRGVEYIEIRNTDVNPFLEIGIDAQQARFLDIFLISCLLMDEHDICANECKMVEENMQKVVLRGREPGLQLNTPRGESSLTEFGTSLLDQMRLTGELLDEVHQTTAYTDSVSVQAGKLKDSSQTPSARVVQALQETGLEYTDWTLVKSREHKIALMQLPSSSPTYRDLAERAVASVKNQRQLEASDTQSFDHFLKDFLAFKIYD